MTTSNSHINYEWTIEKARRIVMNVEENHRLAAVMIGFENIGPDEYNKAKGFILGYFKGHSDGAEERERLDAKIAMDELVPKSEELPQDQLEIFLRSPAHAMIAAIVATKKNIEKRILSTELKETK